MKPSLPATPTIRVVGAAVVDGDRCLVARRAPHVKSPGLWEFPGGKIEADETPQEALRREIREELSLDVDVGSFLGRGTAEVGGRRIVLDVYLATWTAGDPRPTDHDALRWIGADEVSELRWAEADVPVLGALEAFLRSKA